MGAAGFRTLALAAAGTIAGCTSVTTDARTLDGTAWRVAAINGETAPAGLELRFGQGELSGYLGCNRFSGPYRLSSETLTVRPMAMTQMACEPVDDGPRPMFEPAGLAILSQPMKIVWQNGRNFTLNNAAGSIALTALTEGNAR